MRESFASESDAEIDAILVFPSSRFPMSLFEGVVVSKDGGSFLFTMSKEYSWTATKAPSDTWTEKLIELLEPLSLGFSWSGVALNLITPVLAPIVNRPASLVLIKV